MACESSLDGSCVINGGERVARGGRSSWSDGISEGDCTKKWIICISNHYLFGYVRSLQIRETRLSRDVCGTCSTFVSPQYVFEMMFSARSLTKQ